MLFENKDLTFRENVLKYWTFERRMYMTLYAEYENGLNPVVYTQRAYKNLVRAILLTADAEDLYDERDIEIIWEAILDNGDIVFITEKNGARDLVRNSFKMYGDFIDSRLLAMIRDYKEESIFDFLSMHLFKKEITREDDRVLQSHFVSSKDSGFMDCASTTGIRRKNNEDFTGCLVSSLNENIKLLIVCDGMGGFNNGAEASKIVAEEIINWFNSYDFSLGFDNIETEIQKIIESARTIIKKHYFMSGTTLTFALVGERETFICNVGDSRAYIIKDGSLMQVTRDDSEVWEKFYDRENPNDLYSYKKDDLRFLPGNNVLTSAVDDYVVPPVLNTFYISNNLYDSILLTTDGVTDILSDETIIRIFNETEDKDILDKLLYESCYGDPDFPPTNYDEFLHSILPGKDNASGAVYIKKK